MYGLLVTCWLLVTTEASKKGPSTIRIFDLYFGLQNSISLAAYWLSSQMRVEERNMELKKKTQIKEVLMSLLANLFITFCLRIQTTALSRDMKQDA